MKQKKYLKCRGTRHRAQKERGITLIALVITIILLLILAGVTLKIVLDDNFVDKTQLAVDKYSEAQKNETEQIKYFLENYLGEVDNTEGTEHRTLNGADPAYNNPIIPVGFKTSSDGASWTSLDGKTVQGWNDGLVIEDEQGNQFVWVPVDGINVTYTKWLEGKNPDTVTEINKLSEDSLPSGIDEIEQIKKYGGFYIARYEAGIPENMEEALKTANATERNKPGTPVSKKNYVPWNFIDYTNSKANAESMYTGDKVKSSLLTGTMWDTTMKWLENSGVDVKTDSKEWGNYANAPVTGITEYSPLGNDGASWISVSSITKPISGANYEDNIWLLKTGHSEYTKRKNIYDLSGNLWERTNEKYNSDRFVYRSGSFQNSSANYPAVYHNYSDGSNANQQIGFRVALYIQ